MQVLPGDTFVSWDQVYRSIRDHFGSKWSRRTVCTCFPMLAKGQSWLYPFYFPSIFFFHWHILDKINAEVLDIGVQFVFWIIQKNHHSSHCGHPTVLPGLDIAFSTAGSVWPASVTRHSGNLFRNAEMLSSPHDGGTPLCQAPDGTSQHEQCGRWGDLVLGLILWPPPWTASKITVGGRGPGAELRVQREGGECRRCVSQNIRNGLACLAVEVQLCGRWESCTCLREK